MRHLLVLLGMLASTWAVQAQRDFYKSYSFDESDRLRGALRPERSCFDVTFYGLNLTVNPETRQINGYVDINFAVVQDFQKIQLDLAATMPIDRIVWGDTELRYERQFDAVTHTHIHRQSFETGCGFAVAVAQRQQGLQNVPLRIVLNAGAG